MALDNRDLGEMDTIVGQAVDAGEERAWWWSPEPVRLSPAPSERFEPTRFDVITASFQFPCAMVDARAQTLVEGARREGVRHSMSLWQSALQHALELVCRETAHTPREATCAALFWDRVDDEYRVAVTFETPRRPAVAPRH